MENEDKVLFKDKHKINCGEPSLYAIIIKLPPPALSRFLSTRKCSSLPSLLPPLQSPESDKPCSDPEDTEGHLVRAASLPALALETTGGSDTASLQNTRECHYVEM